MKFQILTLLIFCTTLSFAQNILYSTAFIPDSLTENANAVIRKDNTILQIDDISNISIKVEFAITVLNNNADDLANIQIYYDSFSNVDNIKGTVYDKNGNELKKIKKSDIEDYSATSGYSLIEESRVKFYAPLISTYPYTIEYEYEIKQTGSMFYPGWNIFPDYKVSIQNSSFTIIAEKIFYRYFENNFQKIHNIEKTTDLKQNKWNVSNLKAIIEEPYSPSYYDFIPFLLVAPNNFVMDGFEGNMQNWQEFGKWIYKLKEDKSELPEATKTKVKELIADVEDTTEIVKILYKYMQSKTRICKYSAWYRWLATF